MPEMRTYTGGCHCGRVRYETTTDLAQVYSCSCSICTKRGRLRPAGDDSEPLAAVPLCHSRPEPA